MGKIVNMPQFDMSMTEGTITRWYFQEGDFVDKGESLFEAETGKASNAEDYYDKPGKLLKIFVQEGETVPIGTPLCFIGEEGEDIPDVSVPTASAAQPEKASAAAPAASAPAAPKPEKKEVSARAKLDTSGYSYDLTVIGAGPGGYVAAIKAAQLGARVAVVEKDELGGTCLNRGCIPTKALYTSANQYNKMKNADIYGLCAEKVGFDWSKIMARKDSIVKQLTGGVGALLKKNGVTLYKGEAVCKDGHTVTVGDETLTTGYILLATGTTPLHVLQNVDSDVTILTTDELLSIEALPESLAIIGGGVIGCEIANIFASFGVSVTIIELMPTIVPMVDKEISSLLASSLQAKGVRIINGIGTKAVKKQGKLNALELENGETVECEMILEAVGRRTVDTAFAALDLERTPKGTVVVDDTMCTSNETVYAIGDITGGYMLAHEASKQGEIAVNYLFGNHQEEEKAIIPSCIFTEPEIAFVGMTEEKAKEAGYTVKTFKFPFAANGKALTLSESEGFVKVVVDAAYGEILGVHIIGPEASSLIHEAVAAMNLEATAAAAGNMVHAHPTLSEALMEAFLGASTGAIHI